MKQALLAFVVLLIAVASWFVLRSDPADMPEPGAQAPAAAPDSGTGMQGDAPSRTDPDRPGAGSPPAAGPERHEITSAPPAVTTATLRGRCVDAATGEPLEGCTVEVGWLANRKQLDAYLKTHDKIVWKDPEPQTTRANGRFAFTFVPLPSFRFSTDIRAEGRVRVSGRWNALEPGTVKDLGDVPLDGGSVVTGVVADSDGVRQPEVSVYLSRYGRRDRRSELSSRTSLQTRTRKDGTFEMREPVAFGTWTVKLRSREKVAPDELVVPPGQARTVLNIETKPLGEVETITGVLIDDAGEPVNRAHVWYSPSSGGERFIISTKKDGSFRIERKVDETDKPVRISFTKEGHERVESEQRYPWGSADLRFVMRRGLGVDIVVTDAETGEPVEDYGVRCFPDPAKANLRSSRDYEVRERGHHPQGKVTLTGLTRGPRVVMVEPKDETWLTSDFVRFEMTDRGAPTLQVRLSRPVQRTLVIRTAAGDPVVGTKVELLRPPADRAVEPDTRIVSMERLMNYNPTHHAIRVQAGATDAQGELLLRGPGGVALAVLVAGPGHQPFVEADVVLTRDAAPLVLVAPIGAAVTGKIGPPRLIEQLRNGPRARWASTGLLLIRTVDGKQETVPADFRNRIPIAADGTFEARGVPPGTWDLLLEFRIAVARSSTEISEVVATLAGLREGEEREVVADLDHLVAGEVRGKVLVNGVVPTDASVTLVGTGPDGRGGARGVQGPSVKLGKNGEFSSPAMPATYRAQVSFGQGNPDAGLPSVETVVVAPGQTVQQDFNVRVVPLRVRLLGSDGKPAVGLVVNVHDAAQTWGAQMPPTGADGWTELRGTPVGSLILTTAPKWMMDPKTRDAWWKANAGDPNAWTAAMVQLGKVEVKAGGAEAKLEVKLPASSGW